MTQSISSHGYYTCEWEGKVFPGGRDTREKPGDVFVVSE